MHDRPNARARPERTTAQDEPSACARASERRSQRFERHEELLVRGGWKWIEWSAGARQHVSIIRSPGRVEHRYLSATEFELANAVARGIAVKQMAADSSIEWATARTSLNRALRKLGLRSCAHLPAFWYALCGTPSRSRLGDGDELLVFESRLDAQPWGISLTSAERDVLQAVLAGRNNQQIARQRHTSVRTVANQLSTLFHKFGASSKAELAAKALMLMAVD